jgi:CheY-like chemotaxis protein
MASDPIALPSEEELERLAEQEVIDEARDVVADLELQLQAVRSGGADQAQAIKALLQAASNLRLKARSVAIPGLGPLTHRLEDYLGGIRRIEDQHVIDLLTFADRIGAVLDGDAVPPADVPSVVRELPRKKSFDVSEVMVVEVDVTVVLPQRTAARVVERELAACGYRVSTVLDPFEALELIVETRPDLVITGMVMPRLTGTDLACALAAMPSTRSIPVAVLTGLQPGHPDLAALPMNTGLIRRGPQFGDDLAHVLQRFEIT